MNYTYLLQVTEYLIGINSPKPFGTLDFDVKSVNSWVDVDVDVL